MERSYFLYQVLGTFFMMTAFIVLHQLFFFEQYKLISNYPDTHFSSFNANRALFGGIGLIVGAIIAALINPKKSLNSLLLLPITYGFYVLNLKYLYAWMEKWAVQLWGFTPTALMINLIVALGFSLWAFKRSSDVWQYYEININQRSDILDADL